mgnify:CR=1 FL=1
MGSAPAERGQVFLWSRNNELAGEATPRFYENELTPTGQPEAGLQKAGKEDTREDQVVTGRTWLPPGVEGRERSVSPARISVARKRTGVSATKSPLPIHPPEERRKCQQIVQRRKASNSPWKVWKRP